MNLRKIVLLGLVAVAAGLLAIGFISMSSIVDVSAKQWTGVNLPWGVAIGDYNDDGSNDIAFAEYNSGKVIVYKSDGTTILAQWTGLSYPVGVAIGDYNNDGLNDIAFAEREADTVKVYKNDGTTLIKQWTGLSEPDGVAVGDYNNDGLNDLAFTEAGGGRVTVYKSDGTTILAQWIGLSRPYGVAIGDYNNDDLNDLALSEWTGKRVTVFQGTVASVARSTIVTLRGTLTNATGYPIQSGSIRVTILDSFGIQVWQDAFDNIIDNGRYNIPLGTKTTLILIKGQIYNAVLEVDVDSSTFVSADVIYGDNNPAGDIIKFVA